MPSFRTILFAIAGLTASTLAHTWIEEYQVIGPNGSYIGDRGFSRGYTARTDPDFDGDANVLWLLPQNTAVMPDGAVRLRINATDSLCHPNQRTSNYTDPRYPMLKASPGSFVAMKYLENGHVTLPWNQPGKPIHGGTVYVFGTTKPIADEKIVNVMKWTPDGTGGDGRGWLLSIQNFDDGRCHQINDCVLSVERQALYPNMIPGQNVSTEQWCESDVQIPTNLKPGKLTTYWVWQWPTAPEASCTYPQGKDEYYTTCADFEIEGDSPGDIKIIDEIATNTLVQENFQTTAVSTYQVRTAQTTEPVIVEDWNVAIATTFPIAAAWSASCASVLSAQGVQNAAGYIAPPPPSCPAGKWATGAMSEIVAQSAIASAKAAPKVHVVTTAATQATAPPIATGGEAKSGGAGSQAPQGPKETGAAAPRRNGTNPQPSGADGIATMVITHTATDYYTTFITIGAGPGAGSSSPSAPPPAASASPSAFTVSSPAAPAASGTGMQFPTVLTVSRPGNTAVARRHHARAFALGQ